MMEKSLRVDINQKTIREMRYKNMAQLWGGRFTKELDQLAYNFNASITFDQKLYRQDIRGSIAHVTMLAKQGVLTEEEKKKWKPLACRGDALSNLNTIHTVLEQMQNYHVADVPELGEQYCLTEEAEIKVRNHGKARNSLKV